MLILLIGHHWEPISSVLKALEDGGTTRFVGPAVRGVVELAAETNASAIIASMDFYHANRTLLSSLNGDRALLPPVLLCLNHEDAESDDLYQGVEDFVIAPCSASELEKRLRRLALKYESRTASKIIQVGKVTLDLVRYEVKVAGKPLQLAWTEFQLLKFLMQNRGRVFTRDQIMSHVWNTKYIEGTRTVDVHVRRLRYKLGAYAEYLRTVKNVGYGLVEP